MHREPSSRSITPQTYLRCSHQALQITDSNKQITKRPCEVQLWIVFKSIKCVCVVTVLELGSPCWLLVRNSIAYSCGFQMRNRGCILIGYNDLRSVFRSVYFSLRLNTLLVGLLSQSYQMMISFYLFAILLTWWQNDRQNRHSSRWAQWKWIMFYKCSLDGSWADFSAVHTSCSWDHLQRFWQEH